GAIGCASIAAKNSADIRIEDVSFSFEDFIFRAPVGFAGTVMDRATLITVQVHVRTRAGKVGSGFGTIPFNHVFSFPSKHLSNVQKNDAMKALATEIAKVTRACNEFGHPLELNFELAPQYFKAAADLSQRLNLPDPIPRLCTLVTAAAFDAALYDAYGKIHRQNAFDTLSADFMNYDLSRYLGHEFTATYPNKYLLPRPKPRMTLCHLVSAVDPLAASDNTNPLRDGLPETLEEWIDYNGLLELKIKVNGADLTWDVERVLQIDRVTERAQAKRRVKDWSYVLDFNEKCPHVDYFIEFCRELKQRMPIGFSRIKYTEQPTSRNLKSHPENDMHEAAKLCPVVIDESLIDVDSLRIARELGWTGAAVKSPKGLTQMILVACAAAKDGIFLCGGDMSCPGAALIQTANLQARVRTITSVEANARQYLPEANAPWENKFPGMFGARDGILRTSEVAGPGLGVPNAA
ncbi:MAG TPA: enolase C-terminal domain-like protein, partial [Verrucomicrobiae bacterium]|nr:enolase C-terminal domain-like protein [Verrucomicrobiae bacterium]